MRKVVILIAVIALTSCGGNTDEAIEKKIKSKQGQIARLEKQIRELKKQLSDTTEKTRSIPVNVKVIKEEKFDHYILVYGEVEAVNYANISPEIPGKIQKIHVQEGQKVNKGELLVSLNTEAIRNSIEQIKTNLEFAAQTFEKQENLWKQKIGSEIQYMQAKTTKESLEAQLKSLEAQLKMSQIRAPFDGYVDKIFGKEGELASGMMPVIEFVNLSKLSITADVSEVYTGQIKEGQMVEVAFASLPALKYNVPIERVSNVIKKDNRTFEIEIFLNNQGEKIKPFMVSTITINDFSSKNAFVLPSLIIKQDIKGKYVYLAKEEDNEIIASKTYITQGLSYDDQTMVKDGLKAGDQVITNGFNLVSSGIAIQIK